MVLESECPSKKRVSAHVIVLGNEKGGTGKSTLAMHIICCLMHEGFQVGSIDIDARQGTLSRYIENRQNYLKTKNISLPMPHHYPLTASLLPQVEAAQAQDQENLAHLLNQLNRCHFIVIDTPGSNTFLSKQAHSYADTLITPLNDSFIDLDLLVRLDHTDKKILKPSVYAEMVWEQRKFRAVRDTGTIDWIVLRNRLSGIRARNKEEMEKVLSVLSKRIGFRLCSGFGERVIFKELFLSGLTLLDMENTQGTLTLSHVTARQELRTLMATISHKISLEKTG